MMNTTLALDIRRHRSNQAPAGAGFPPSVMDLLDAARQALDLDHVAAGGLISRAAALLRAGEPADGPATGRLAPWQVRRLEAHIDANLEGRISIDDLAAVARLSASYLTRAFKRSFGASPHVYVTRRRMERAEAMMLTTDESLCQVALACGLSCQAHFSRVFLRHSGMSPGAWRRRYRAGPVAADCGRPGAHA
ncbi:MAG: helix-turn-helix domain-containing protein [Alphaproteobacteria bacterium]